MTAKELPANDWRRAVYGRGQIGGIGIRRRPRLADRERIIAKQGYVCLYCEIPIGTMIIRNNRDIMLRANWDHFIPYAYSQRNPSDNWVLACHVCNGLKLARMFADVETARQAILPERAAKGYESADSVFHRLDLEVAQRRVILTVARPTDRQLEALALIAEGRTAIKVGLEMGISSSSVASLLQGAMRRMGVKTQRHAIETAVRNGFIPAPRQSDQTPSEPQP